MINQNNSLLKRYIARKSLLSLLAGIVASMALLFTLNIQHADAIVFFTVSTNAATSITADSAILNGAITSNGGGDATESGFAFGTDPLFVVNSATSTLGGQFGITPFSETKSSLTCGTTYYFRAYGINPQGLKTGILRSFTTSACPQPEGRGTLYNGGSSAPAGPTTPPGVSYINGVPVYTPVSATSSTTSSTTAVATTTVVIASSTTATATTTGTATTTTTTISITCPAGLLCTPVTVLPQSLPAGSHLGYQFLKDLKMGMRDADVLALQQFLNAHGFEVAANGNGSIGNETTYFGNSTKAALIRFQVAAHITPAAGYFGRITRQLVNGY